MSHNEFLVDMGLETVCPDCEGEGFVETEPMVPVPCGTCEGNGWIPTDRGRAILELVRRWP
jgi:DnaJ-class molecular chaperone